MLEKIPEIPGIRTPRPARRRRWASMAAL